MHFLEGAKTYIIAGILILMSVLKAMRWMDAEDFLAIMGVLIGASQITLRSGIKKDTGNA